jgi:Cu2+-exporting ATPase
MQAMGLLVKRAIALEKLVQVTHVVFDKTGTLTLGRPALRQVFCGPGIDRATALALAALLEQHSAHPLAQTLRREAGDLGAHEVGVVSQSAGKGMHGSIDGVEYCLGNVDFIGMQSTATVPENWLQSSSADGHTSVVLATASEILAMFTFSDEMRDDAVAAIAALRDRGKTVLLMTGDTRAAASQVAAQTGIEDWRAQMTPQQKMAAVQALQAESAVVLMVGDGINDAPVLAAADVSIAVAGASSLAKINADIVLLRDHLGSVVSVFAMANRTRRVIQQNMTWALLYNFGAIPAAAAGLLAPWVAALGMSLSSLLVVVNALRLTR